MSDQLQSLWFNHIQVWSNMCKHIALFTLAKPQSLQEFQHPHLQRSNVCKKLKKRTYVISQTEFSARQNPSRHCKVPHSSS